MTETLYPERQPDPSTLTTAMMLRELNSLEAVVNEKIASVLVQISMMDRAQALFHEDLVRVPTAVDKAVGNLKELLLQTRDERFHGMDEKLSTISERFSTMDEKFAGVQIQFRMSDERVKQTAIDTKTAVDAALAAQEKAVSKQNESNEKASEKAESNFTKQIEQQRQLLEITTRGFNERIDNLKDLVLRGEGRDSGKASSLGTLFSLIAAAGVIIGLVIAILKMS